MSSDIFLQSPAVASAGRRGLHRFIANHPVLVDVTVAVLYVLVMTPGFVHGLIFSVDTSTGQFAVGLAATLCAGVALVFRRRAPIVVLATVLAFVLIVKTLVFGFTDPLGIAVAGFAAGAYVPQRRAWIAVASAIVVVIVAIVIGAPLSTEALPVDTLLILNLVLFVPACLLGLLVNVLRSLREAEGFRVVHEMQEQVQAVELTAAQQRATLSREMHDVVGHSLTAIINLSDGALRASTMSPEVLEVGLRRINSIARDALGETRTILDTLRPENEAAPRAPVRPIEAATPAAKSTTPYTAQEAELGIRSLLDTAESTGLSAHLTVGGEPAFGAPSADVRNAAYRIVQESITNTMRHAQGATELSVTVVYSPESLVVQVHDNGHTATSTAPLGNGLEGAADRVALLGGTLHAGPAPAGGWHVTASIPMNRKGLS